MVVLLAVCALAPFASVAGAELTERGDLFVSFQGGIEPNALPRTRLAPDCRSATTGSWSPPLPAR